VHADCHDDRARADGAVRGGITLAPTRVPCGTVTFVITDTGPLSDSLSIFSEAPPVFEATPELAPGQTTSLTPRFAAKGAVYLQSNTFQPEGNEGNGGVAEFAWLTLV